VGDAEVSPDDLVALDNLGIAPPHGRHVEDRSQFSLWAIQIPILCNAVCHASTTVRVNRLNAHQGFVAVIKTNLGTETREVRRPPRASHQPPRMNKHFLAAVLREFVTATAHKA
jgi:hypothetical protein